MRFIGLDCSTVRVGWAVVDVIDGEYSLLASGDWHIGKGKQSTENRLASLDRSLRAVLAGYGGDVCVVETAFAGVNVQSALRISEVRGVAILCAGQAGLAIKSVAPASVKKSVAGHGRADKSEVASAVKELFAQRPVFGSEDESDAVAIAVCGHLLLDTITR